MHGTVHPTLLFALSIEARFYIYVAYGVEVRTVQKYGVLQHAQRRVSYSAYKHKSAVRLFPF